MIIEEKIKRLIQKIDNSKLSELYGAKVLEINFKERGRWLTKKEEKELRLYGAVNIFASPNNELNLSYTGIGMYMFRDDSPIKSPIGLKLLPSHFASIPLDINKRTANEIMSYLAKTGDTFRELTWEEYEPIVCKMNNTSSDYLPNWEKKRFEKTYSRINTPEKCIDFDPLWFVPTQNYKNLIEVFRNKPYASKEFCNEPHTLESNTNIRNKYRELLPFLTDAQILATTGVVSELLELIYKTSTTDFIHWEYDVENE